MRDVESKWLASVRKNVEIEWSCRQLEAKIAEREAAKENHEAEGEGEARKEAAEEVEGGAMDTA